MTYGGAAKVSQNDKPTSTAGDVSIQIGGDLSGQLIVGNNNQTYSYSYNVAHGGVLNVAAPPTVSPRALPLNLKPRPFAQLLDRQNVLPVIREALQQSQPVEIFAADGFGKTALLRHLAHDENLTARFSAGVVYLPVADAPVDDVLQSLYDVFYDASPPFKPSYGQTQQALKDKQALVILNGLSWTAKEMERLLAAMPGCTFVLISTARLYWQEGAAIALKGLPFPESVALIQKDLGRSLSEAEQRAAKRLWQTLSGSPLQLRRAAAQAKEIDQQSTSSAAAEPAALVALVQTMQLTSDSPEPEDSLFQAAARRLSKSQKAALGLMGAMAGNALSAQQALGITQAPAMAAALDELVTLQLVEFNGSGYSLCTDLTTAVQQNYNPQPWLEQATHYFIEQGSGNVAQECSSAAMQHLLTWTQQTQKWQQSLALVRCLDSSLSVNGQWGQWQQALSYGLHAAEQLGDRQAEAWMLHQLGTRSLAIGNLSQAQPWLSQAVKLREQLADTAGAAISKHNLSLIGPALVPMGGASNLDRDVSPTSAPRTPLRRWVTVGSILVGIVLLGNVGRTLWSTESPGENEQVIVSTPEGGENERTRLSDGPSSDGRTLPPQREESTEPNAAAQTTESDPQRDTNETTIDEILSTPETDVQKKQSEAASDPENNDTQNETPANENSEPDNNLEPDNTSQQNNNPTQTDTLEQANQTLNDQLGQVPVQATIPAQEVDIAEVIQQPPTVKNYSRTIQAGESLTVDLLAGASDPNPDDTLQLYEIANTPVGGVLQDNGDGTVTYIPYKVEAGQTGSYTNTFQFVITDGNGNFAEGTLSIRVELPKPGEAPGDALF